MGLARGCRWPRVRAPDRGEGDAKREGRRGGKNADTHNPGCKRDEDHRGKEGNVREPTFARHRRRVKKMTTRARFFSKTTRGDYPPGGLTVNRTSKGDVSG